MDNNQMSEDLVDRLEKRAEIRRNISTRKSVQEGKSDRIADILEEAAYEIRLLRGNLKIEREGRINDSCGLNQYGE
jgi:hypothetical protein